MPTAPTPSALLMELWSRRQSQARPVGILSVTSGAIIACDPLEFVDCAEPFARSVPRGRFPVRAFLSSTGNVSLALLELAPGPPMQWEPALSAGEATDALGYPVESGVGAFLDGEAALILVERQQRRRARRAELERAGPPAPEAWAELDRELPLDPLIRVRIPLGAGSAGQLVLDRASGADVVFFTSGAGPGTYRSYWGLDSNGQPSALATDFTGLSTAAPPPPEAPEELSAAEQRSAASAGRLLQLLVEANQLSLKAGASLTSLAREVGLRMLSRPAASRPERVMEALLEAEAIDEVFLSDEQLAEVLDSW